MLDNLTLPADIKHLSFFELNILAKELRSRILEALSKNPCGGHLASNLGIVEITLALHKVFNAPIDRFIFDTSHQTYIHKMLTGRDPLLHTLRQLNGLCGFSSPMESIYDHFYAGHAGTALSLAIGVAKSRDLSCDTYHVIPIIGDAALSCGLTLEALNNIPANLKKFLIVLNDNNMYISPSVGTINELLRTTGYSNKQISFFENFNLDYIGPIDGHNLEALIHTFESLKNIQKPTLLHLITQKGKGMNIAVEKPTAYHGVRPFHLDTGEFIQHGITSPKFPQIFGNYLLHLADTYDHVVAITPAMPAGSCVTSFMKKYPNRCIDVGIAEGHSVTYAGGIASCGKQKVFACIYATFLQRALDNVFQDVCLQEIPVVFALDRAGIAGPDGATHNGIYDIGFLNSMPNMIIAQPREGHVLKELMLSSLDWKQPGAIRYPNLATTEPNLPIKKREIGKAEIIKQGKDIVIIALGHKIEDAITVHENLLMHGIQATVIDPVFIKPLDATLLREVFLTHFFVITIEEHVISTGLASIIDSFIIKENIPGLSIHHMGIGEEFIHHGSHPDITKALKLDPDSITDYILSKMPAFEFASKD
ncbi:MAG: 1-deoxy-D-xylulose-5-phosphate synthase [Chlamydiales bacterium]|nr:1-deoxy-D-xylulose-5-phosphate synthase [Chlamydiales bacterium]